MVRYYCDRCEKEIKEEQSDCKLCVDCMRKYIKFIKGGDIK